MSDERTVEIGGVPAEKVAGALHTEGVLSDEDGVRTGQRVRESVPRFHKEDFGAFVAEYGVREGDIVVHFFLPSNGEKAVAQGDTREKQGWMDYWLQTFPNILSPTAQEYFQATKPRIIAKYTEELASWWFLARGFGGGLDPITFVRGFLEKLAVSVNTANTQTQSGNQGS